jgi:hypothetical protein
MLLDIPEWIAPALVVVLRDSATAQRRDGYTCSAAAIDDLAGQLAESLRYAATPEARKRALAAARSRRWRARQRASGMAPAAA